MSFYVGKVLVLRSNLLYVFLSYAFLALVSFYSG